MPRAKVDPSLRKRVARACDLCRKRKEKCTGGDPCPQCRERGTEEQCQYTPVQKSPYSRSPRPGKENVIADEGSPAKTPSPATFKQRQRVVIACDACRKRKERCDGQKPACGACCLRGMEAACSYTPITASQAQRASRPNADVLLRGQNSGASGSHGIDQDVNEYRTADVYSTPRASSGNPVSMNTEKGAARASKAIDPSLLSAPVPKLSRMLKDGKGGFVYVGDSSSASFLQSIRRHVAASLGQCKFTTDDARHTMPEDSPLDVTNLHDEPLPSLPLALNVAYFYSVSISGLLDLFDQSWLIDQLPSWIQEQSLRQSKPNSPIIYLALAIGLQGRNLEDDDKIAEQCFAFGRKLAISNLMDSPSLHTVQAFTLISYYLLAAYRRNSAYVNLGIAVRAAYVLGIHRHEANAASLEDGLSRERIWKSLRALDLFMSASMGRPSATSEPDCNVPWASLEVAVDRETSTVPAQASSAIFRICDILERILTEVYSKRFVSIDLAGSISTKHKEWTNNLPKMLEIDGLSEFHDDSPTALSRKVGSNIVTMAYYYSIILLTRPFLEYRVSSPQNKVSRPNTIVQSGSIDTYADGCVDSAIQAISVGKDLIDNKMPKRQPLIINSIFTGALCIGLAYFGDYDQKGWPLGRSLDSAITILQRLGRANPQSARYAEICILLEDATRAYVKRRDDSWLQSSSRHVRNVFGDLQTTESPQPGPSQQQTPSYQPFSQLVDAAHASGLSAQMPQTPSRAPAAYMASAPGTSSDMMQGGAHTSAAQTRNSNAHVPPNTHLGISSGISNHLGSSTSLSFGD